MNTTDTISDMLTRIRNAMRAGHEKTEIPASRQREAVLAILAREGYVAGFKALPSTPQRKFQVRLKYDSEGTPVIEGVSRISRPGRRVYCRAADIAPVLGGIGMSVISTSRGIMSDREAREQKLGGEILFNIW
jgi:small subunit ribosomal protein S8